jgi:hypothetical protein
MLLNEFELDALFGQREPHLSGKRAEGILIEAPHG